MIDPNSKTFQKVFKNKRRTRFIIYAELLYALILFLAVIYDIAIFFRLVVIQFVVLFVFFALGWLIDRHDRRTGKAITNQKDHAFFLKTFMEEPPIQKQKSIFRTVSFIAIVLSFLIAAFSCEQVFALIALKPASGAAGIIQDVVSYGDVFYLLTMSGIMFGLLFGKKRLERDSSLASLFLSLLLIAFLPTYWWIYLCGILVSVAGYVLYRLNQL